MSHILLIITICLPLTENKNSLYLGGIHTMGFSPDWQRAFALQRICISVFVCYLIFILTLSKTWIPACHSKNCYFQSAVHVHARVENCSQGRQLGISADPSETESAVKKQKQAQSQSVPFASI